MNNATRKRLAQEALEKAAEVRDEFGHDSRTPMCIYDLAHRAHVSVQFTADVSMEGIYTPIPNPLILLSSLRPLGRRAFTCAHELGHHFFNHSATIDELREDGVPRKVVDEREFLADTFAGYLLMPTQAVLRRLTAYGTSPERATAAELYRCASAFGVGYSTLVAHLTYSLRRLRRPDGEALGRIPLSRIRAELLGFESAAPLAVLDPGSGLGVLDVEVGTDIMLPSPASLESPCVSPRGNTRSGPLIRALRPGIARVVGEADEWAALIRISRHQYSGLARYRHLEDEGDD